MDTEIIKTILKHEMEVTFMDIPFYEHFIKFMKQLRVQHTLVSKTDTEVVERFMTTKTNMKILLKMIRNDVIKLKTKKKKHKPNKRKNETQS